MIAETRDPAIINYFAAHSEIAKDVGGPIDFTGAMRETAVFHFGEHGGLCYEWCAPDTYEVHIMLTKAGRGRWGIAATRQSLGMLGASHVWARVKPDDRKTALFALWCGFREIAEMTLFRPEPARWRIMDWRSECPQQ